MGREEERGERGPRKASSSRDIKEGNSYPLTPNGRGTSRESKSGFSGWWKEKALPKVTFKSGKSYPEEGSMPLQKRKVVNLSSASRLGKKKILFSKLLRREDFQEGRGTHKFDFFMKGRIIHKESLGRAPRKIRHREKYLLMGRKGCLSG